MAEVPYLSPFIPNYSEEEKKSSVDEGDYSTLKNVQKIINNCIDGLSHDFNAFDVLNKPNKQEAAEILLVDIQARQLMRAFLLNLKVSVDSAIGRIDEKNTKQ